MQFSGEKCISCPSPTGSVSTQFRTDSLLPLGICQTLDRDLLVTLIDTDTDIYEPSSHSRRLVRHVTLTGDVIHEYEYKEDGKTRLYTVPFRFPNSRKQFFRTLLTTRFNQYQENVSLVAHVTIVLTLEALIKAETFGEQLMDGFFVYTCGNRLDISI